MTAFNPATPSFNLQEILGFPTTGAVPFSQELNKEKETESKKVQEAIDTSSWLKTGHPLGELEDDQVQMGLLAQFPGRAFTSLLTEEESRSTVDPHMYLANFFNELKENTDALNKFGLSKEQIEKMSETLTSSQEVAAELTELIALGGGENDESKARLIKALATKLKDQLQAKRVLWIPILAEDGSYTLILRIDAARGFSVINASGSDPLALSGAGGGELGAEAMMSALTSGTSSQTAVKQTRIDPLTGNTIEEFRTQQFVSFETEETTKVGDLRFFETLLKGIACPQWGIQNFSASPEKMIYESLPQYINGKRINIDEQQHGELFKKAPRFRDGALKNITNILYYMACDSFFAEGADGAAAVLAYKKVKFLWESQILISCCRKWDSERTWDRSTEEQRNFINDVVHNLLRTSVKLFQQGGLSVKQLSDFKYTCTQITDTLSRVQRAPAARVPAPVYPDQPTVDAISLPPRVQHLGGIGGVGHDPNEDMQTKGVKQFIKQFVDLPNLDFSANPQQVLEEVNEWTRTCFDAAGKMETDPHFVSIKFGRRNEARHSESSAAFNTLFQALGDLISKMPVPERGDASYWMTISEEQARAYFELCGRLSDVVIQAAVAKSRFSNRNWSVEHDPEVSLMLYALYAISMKIGTRLPETNLSEQSFAHYPLINQIRSPYFIIKHPGMQNIVHSLMRYFNPNWNSDMLRGPNTPPEFEKLNKELFSFTEVSRLGAANQFFSLHLKEKDPTATVPYLFELLKDDNRVNAIKDILTKENQKLEEEYLRRVEEYEEALRQYEARKKELEANLKAQKDLLKLRQEAVKTETANLVNSCKEEDRPLITEIFKKRTALATAWELNKRRTILNEITTLNDKLSLETRSRMDEIDRAREEIYERNDLDGVAGEIRRNDYHLSHLNKPVKPTHPGQYPINSKLDQIATLFLHAEGKPLVPEAVKTLMNRALRCMDFMYLNSNEVSMKFGFHSNEWGPLPLEQQKSRAEIKLKVYRETNGYSEQLDMWGVPDQNTHLANPFPLRGPDAGDLLHFVTIEESHNLTQNESMVTRGERFGLDVQGTRELYMLGLDTYDSMNRTIGFFRNHIGILDKPEIQSLIRMHLFRPERIHSQLRDNPACAKSVAEFIQVAINHYRDMKDVDTCLFLVRLGHEVKLTAEKMGYKGAFPDYRDFVLEHILPAEKENHIKLKIYRTLVLLHENIGLTSTVTPEQQRVIRQDIIALQVIKKLQTRGSDISPPDAASLDGVLHRFSLSVQQCDEEDVAYAAAVALPNLDKGAVWTNRYPIFTSSIYEINVATGLVTANNKPIVQTPDWIMDSELLREVYPHKITENGCNRHGKYMYSLNTGSDQEILVISYDQGRNIEIIQQVEGQVYRYIPTPENLAAAMPTVFDKGVKCWAKTGFGDPVIRVIKDNQKAYEIKLAPESGGGENAIQSITRTADNYIWEDFNNHHDLFKGLPVFEDEARLIECWRSPDNKECVVDFKRLGLSFSFNPTRSDPDEKKARLLSEVVKLLPEEAKEDPAKLKTSLMTSFGEVLPANFFNVITAEIDKLVDKLQKEDDSTLALKESELFITAYRAAMTPDSVRRLYSTLSRKLDPEDQVQCQQFPGFSLVDAIPMETIGNRSPYLTLQNDLGEKKVLLPRSVTGQLARTLDKPLTWFEYDVIENGTTDITSGNVELQLFQMYLWVIRKDYVKAKQILDKVNCLARLSAGEKEILQTMQMSMLDPNMKMHPEAQCLWLRLSLLQENNELKFPLARRGQEAENGNQVGGGDEERQPRQEMTSDKQKALLLAVIYLNYVKNRGNATVHLLTDEEERQTLEMLHRKLKKSTEDLSKLP